MTLSNAFLAVTAPRGIPDRQREPARYGAWVENACLAHASNEGQRVNYWREEPLEVDAIRRDLGKWAIEVKTDGIAAVELRGLAEFVRRNREYRPLVLCDQPDAIAVERLGIQAMRWQNFLLTGPPKT